MRLLTWEDKVAQHSSQYSQSASGQLLKIFDDYSNKVESATASMNEKTGVVLKQLA